MFRAWLRHVPSTFRWRRRLLATDRVRNVLIRYAGVAIAAAAWRAPCD